MNESKKVYVSCATYNQAAYIKDAMNGFCMQRTDFPFVCGIIDDASEDGEPDVISSYLEEHFDLGDSGVSRKTETEDCVRVFARHKENKNCFFVVVFLKYNHYQIKKAKDKYVEEWRNDAKYIALCEGDDYWTDPLKLQKQVDFMEQHPNHSLCFSAHRNEYPNGSFRESHRYNFDMESCSVNDAIRHGGNYMATATMLYRSNKVANRPEWSIGLPIGDLPTMLVLLGRGECGYINNVMVTYRVNTEGSWTRTMMNNKAKKLYLFSSVKRMYKAFDFWTLKKYHCSIVKRCLKIGFYSFWLKLGLLK